MKKEKEGLKRGNSIYKREEGEELLDKAKGG